MRAFTLILRDEDAAALAGTEEGAGSPTHVTPPEGKTVLLAIPGDRAAVAARMSEAVGVWLVRTPPIRQSASSLTRFLMEALERGEVPADEPVPPQA